MAKITQLINFFIYFFSYSSRRALACARVTYARKLAHAITFVPLIHIIFIFLICIRVYVLCPLVARRMVLKKKNLEYNRISDDLVYLCGIIIEYLKIMADISCNLPLSLLKKLEEEKELRGKTTTVIIQEALTMYFESGILTQKDLDAIKELLKPLLYPIPKVVPLRASDIISNLPEHIMSDITIPRRPRPHLDNLRLPSEEPVRPGPGAMERLKARGIDPKDVLLARRAKSKGREYNVELEQYFDLLNG